MSRSFPHSRAGARAARRPARRRAAVGAWLEGLAVAIVLPALWASAPGPRAALAQASPGPASPAPDTPRRGVVPAPEDGSGAGSEPGSASGRDLDDEDDEDGEDDEDTTGEPRPWAEGVSLERQSRARALYAEANALLHEYLL